MAQRVENAQSAAASLNLCGCAREVLTRIRDLL
jgi:hypothetical protein